MRSGGMHGRGHVWHTVNERVVRILLECILVLNQFTQRVVLTDLQTLQGDTNLQRPRRRSRY